LIVKKFLCIVPAFALFNACVVQGPNNRVGDTLISGTVSFEQHIKPMFDMYCGTSCHVHSSAGGLSTATYASLKAGGVSGAVIVSGDPTNSLLIKRLRGDILPQMPTGDEPFTENQIANIVHWIEQGAKDN
jgi:hypothetical protein